MGFFSVDNPILELAKEFNDRSLDHAGNATVYPTDYEILELFWTDWMESQGQEIQDEKNLYLGD